MKQVEQKIVSLHCEGISGRIRGLLASGGLVVFATESSYGIAARVDRPRALERLSLLKNRPATSPFGTVALDQKTVESLCSFTPELEVLASQWWPGPMTLALNPKRELHTSLLSPAKTVGVRVSPHPVASLVCLEGGGIVTATSANLRGGSPAYTVEDLSTELIEQVDLVIDSGPAARGVESSVVGWAESGLQVFREGAISESAIRLFLKNQGF